MGLFDSVYADCPRCGSPVEFQTKADEAPYLNRFTLDDAPDHLLRDILNKPHHCGACGGWFALVDPVYPVELPRPKPTAAKVKTPIDAARHEQGLEWWPWGRPFLPSDMEPTSEVTNGE